MKTLLLSLVLLLPIFSNAQTWATYSPFGDSIGVLSIALNNDKTAWFLAGRSDGHDVAMVARTTDEGATFNTSTLPLQNPPFATCITSSDESTAFVIALQNWGNSVTLVTYDGGQTWQNTNTPWDPVVSWPDYIHAFSAAKICQIGDPRNGEFEVYTTGNGGINWGLVNSANIPDALPGETAFNNGGGFYGNHIWFGTSKGRLFHSANAGNLWDVVQTPLAAAGAMSYSDENNGIVTYWGNPNGTDQLFRTKDGGATWDSVTLPISGTYHFYGVPEYLKGTPIMVAGVYTEPQFFGNNQTWVSYDRGDNWTQISDGEIIGWPTFNSPTNGWAGEWGPIIPTDHTTWVYKYTGSPLVGLFSPEQLDAEITLSPNPASDLLRVKVQAQEAGDFWVLLNDAQGRLVKKETESGVSEFEKTLEIKNLPAGIYALTVSGTKGSLTRKFAKQ